MKKHVDTTQNENKSGVLEKNGKEILKKPSDKLPALPLAENQNQNSNK